MVPVPAARSSAVRCSHERKFARSVAARTIVLPISRMFPLTCCVPHDRVPSQVARQQRTTPDMTRTLSGHGGVLIPPRKWQHRPRRSPSICYADQAVI